MGLESKVLTQHFSTWRGSLKVAKLKIIHELTSTSSQFQASEDKKNMTPCLLSWM